ncbi:hypothetical protein GCM10010252_01550 [Streptomyces aureoverticillatus]|nr:hypothetical protein GCM10010252_01550 [Streptomyces aureoverticillatus]
MSKKRQGSRTTPGKNNHPATQRSYILRSYVMCDLCNRRMFGKSRHQISYYACEPDPNEHRSQPWFPTHPKSLWIREEDLLTSVSYFFATCVFGPDRRTHLNTALEAARHAVDGPAERVARERDALGQAIAAIEQRQNRLIQALAEGMGGIAQDEGPDPDDERAFRDGIRKEHTTLGAQRKALSEQMARLETPGPVAKPDNAALLDALPYLKVDLTRVPEEKQRQLYDAFGLEVRYSRPREELALRVTIPGHMVDALARITRGLDMGNKKSGARTEVLTPDHGTRARKSRHTARSRSHVVGAPGRIRTCAHGSGGRCSIP